MKYFKRPKRVEVKEPEIEKDEIGKDEIQSSLGFRKSTVIAEISCTIATIITIVMITVVFLTIK